MLPEKAEPGLVIRYSFLWRHEADKGRVEGAKDRPVLVVVLLNNDQEVIVAPFTTKAPMDDNLAVEVPAGVRRHLGLDETPCWISIDTINQFVWPGPDVRAIPRSNPPSAIYGFLPQRLLDVVKAKAVQQLLKRVPGFVVQRSAD